MKIREAEFYNTRISEWPEGERPREKLMQIGPSQLSDAELMAILLRTGTRSLNAVDIARAMITRLGNLQTLSRMELAEFSRITGIGPVKAVTLIAAFELGRRIASQPAPERLKINGPEVVFRRFEPLMSHLQKEIFLILVLNSANAMVREIQISEGTLNASLVHPREVFKPAILASAASVILVHNHPSGEVVPSSEDKQITRRLVETGQLLDVPVIDHIIIGQKKYFSFREEGMIG